MGLKIAVLFDGAGLARLGIEQAGHECTGFEINPVMHYLGQFVGSGRCILSDATTVDLNPFDAVWASPPCQRRSNCPKDLTGGGGLYEPQFANDLLQWCLDNIKNKVSWIENVTVMTRGGNDWGKLFNAAQFLEVPIQCRNRVIGGNYINPYVFRQYKRAYPSVCPCITATEYKGCASDRIRASRYYGRKLKLEECGYHQGFEVPEAWSTPEFGMTAAKWNHTLYRAIGNGVPVYMARAFGLVYK